MTLDEALAGRLVEVTEKDLEGSAPELQLVNKAPQMVLILDGEKLAHDPSLLNMIESVDLIRYRIEF